MAEAKIQRGSICEENNEEESIISAEILIYCEAKCEIIEAVKYRKAKIMRKATIQKI
jgi:hypothetical protein